MKIGWTRRAEALFVLLADGSVFAVRGPWWVGSVSGFRVRAKWRDL